MDKDGIRADRNGISIGIRRCAGLEPGVTNRYPYEDAPIRTGRTTRVLTPFERNSWIVSSALLYSLFCAMNLP